MPGLSERIHAVSIVDRYLEHARVFYFANDGHPEYLLASADWMPRNLDRRVEIAFPILEPALQHQVLEILQTQLADTRSRPACCSPTAARCAAPATGDPPLRSQSDSTS